jgi:SAM-dependent methyltransferase
MYAQLSEAETVTEKLFKADRVFNRLYPQSIGKLDGKHWTPLHIAKKAAEFLAADNGMRILDIGSGVGKFCLGAAYHKPDAYYVGIEQRKYLTQVAENARAVLKLDNVRFIEGNFTQLDFRNYDHFYFFNAFYENLFGTEKIDHSIEYSTALYDYYNHYLYTQLELKPAGTKLATFHSLEYEIPPGYHAVGAEFDDLLRFWVKI